MARRQRQGPVQAIECYVSQMFLYAEFISQTKVMWLHGLHGMRVKWLWSSSVNTSLEIVDISLDTIAEM